MSQATIAAGFTQEAFDAFVAERNEPGWMTDLRRDALEKFLALPLPDRQNEEWMRTDIRTLHLDRYGLPSEPGDDVPRPQGLLRRGVELAGHVETLDGYLQSAEFDRNCADQGVVFGSLPRLIAEHGDKLKPFMYKALDPGYDKFSALHAAFWTSGTVLYVPRGVTVDEPLYALSAMTDGGVDLGHTLVILEDGATATLLAETSHAEENAAGFHCGGVELHVGPRANLRYVNLQNWGSKTWHFAHQKGRVGQDAGIQWTIGALGGKLAKVNQHVALVGRGAHAQVNGVMFTEGKQHLCYHTLQHHEAPECRSDLLYKGALQDRSRIVWRGMIKVDPGAQKTDGYQRNDNLILNREARADSIPGLEIEADDVRCTHGATSGKVDEEQIFYCQTRGLSRKEAVRTIVTGFFQQVSDRITIESVREALAEAISLRIKEFE